MFLVFFFSSISLLMNVEMLFTKPIVIIIWYFICHSHKYEGGSESSVIGVI